MAKRPGDPFGLSLMDVLSNALGGTLLLMMIVAASIGLRDEEQRELPAEEGGGEFETVKIIPLRRVPSDKPDLSLLVIQIRFWGSRSIKLYLNGIESDESCSIGSIANDPSEWLVIRKGRRDNNWSVIAKAQSIQDLPEKITVLATSDDLAISFERKVELNWKSKGKLQHEILYVTEYPNKPPVIKLSSEDY
ncbi:MAG: hypothetical protein DKINENOH_04869 [bacterium]|nr:hypothetical protein [bacterium]